MMAKGYNPNLKYGVTLKKHLPKTISFRELARKKILTRNSSYRLNHLGAGIMRKTAEKICAEYNLDLDEYFYVQEGSHPYSIETVKNLRKNIRTIFSEAVRYEWIASNPVSKTKVGNTNGRINLVFRVFTLFVQYFFQVFDISLYLRFMFSFTLNEYYSA